jgi:hypothetical protein
MKTLAAAILINLIAYTARADGPVGRFQLVPVITETSGIGTVLQSRTVFKIDTVTGQTWEYISTHIKGKLVENWVEIEQ